MDFERRSSALFEENIEKLRYKPMPCTTFEVAIFPVVPSYFP
jgi:hypothetical protein